MGCDVYVPVGIISIFFPGTLRVQGASYTVSNASFATLAIDISNGPYWGTAGIPHCHYSVLRLESDGYLKYLLNAVFEYAMDLIGLPRVAKLFLPEVIADFPGFPKPWLFSQFVHTLGKYCQGHNLPILALLSPKYI